MILCIYL